MKIIPRSEIEKSLSIPKVLEAIEEGFVSYSLKETVVPPIASLKFESPPGDCHIKYGYAKKGNYYVVKIASGFYDNPKNGTPSTNGLMLLFDKRTGTPVSLLLDEGYLTDMRTAAAGCIAAKYLAPKEVSCVGIIGTGAQALYQLKLLSFATSCRKAMIWGRSREKAEALANLDDLRDWRIEVSENIDQLTSNCNLIVTTTASSTPLLFAHQIRPGTHITAIGSDDIGKQEIDENFFLKADKVVVDCKNQCVKFGETSFALEKRLVKVENVVELGSLILNPSLGRTSDEQITVCDLTGIAIQDLQIAENIYLDYCKRIKIA